MMLNAYGPTDHQFSGGHQKKEVMGLGWAGGVLGTGTSFLAVSQRVTSGPQEDPKVQK